MIILLKFWRECIIALLVFLLLICLFIQNYQSKKIKSANAACKAEIAKIELAQHQAQVAEQNKVNEVSATYEEDRAERPGSRDHPQLRGSELLHRRVRL